VLAFGRSPAFEGSKKRGRCVVRKLERRDIATSIQWSAIELRPGIGRDAAPVAGREALQHVFGDGFLPYDGDVTEGRRRRQFGRERPKPKAATRGREGVSSCVDLSGLGQRSAIVPKQSGRGGKRGRSVLNQARKAAPNIGRDLRRRGGRGRCRRGAPAAVVALPAALAQQPRPLFAQIAPPQSPPTATAAEERARPWFRRQQ